MPFKKCLEIEDCISTGREEGSGNDCVVVPFNCPLPDGFLSNKIMVQRSPQATCMGYTTLPSDFKVEPSSTLCIKLCIGTGTGTQMSFIFLTPNAPCRLHPQTYTLPNCVTAAQCNEPVVIDMIASPGIKLGN